MDPHIKEFEVIEENDEHVIVRTGFEGIIRKKFADPMPEWLGFDTDMIDKVDAFEFEDPWGDQRYFHGGDNQLGGVGDGYARNLPRRNPGRSLAVTGYSVSMNERARLC